MRTHGLTSMGLTQAFELQTCTAHPPVRLPARAGSQCVCRARRAMSLPASLPDCPVRTRGHEGKNVLLPAPLLFSEWYSGCYGFCYLFHLWGPVQQTGEQWPSQAQVSQTHDNKGSSFFSGPLKAYLYPCSNFCPMSKTEVKQHHCRRLHDPHHLRGQA